MRTHNSEYLLYIGNSANITSTAAVSMRSGSSVTNMVQHYQQAIARQQKLFQDKLSPTNSDYYLATAN